MERHAPDGYACPFCMLLAGSETEHNRLADIVYRDEGTAALVSPKWWSRNEGHVLVIPAAHHENLYEIPAESLAAVHTTASLIATAIRETYSCDGTSVRQHNEPGAGQDVWHFHVHVFPRYLGDDLYRRDDECRWATAEERTPYAERLARTLAHYPQRS
jgi:histidine triad (HIT) family protein